MEINYKNTLEDYLNYLNLCNDINPKEKITFNIEKYSLLVGSIAILFYNIIKYKYINLEFIIFVIGIIVLNLLWIIYFQKIIQLSYKIYIKSLVKKNIEMILEKCLRIDNDDITLLKQNSVKVININDISKVIEDKNNIYLFTKKYDIYAIVPIKFLDGIEGKEKFLSLLNI